MTNLFRTILATLAALLLAPAAYASEHELPRVAVNGGEMEYAEYGNPDGEPVILIHGGMVADAFLPLAMTYELSDYRVILVHLRGHAGSLRIEAPFGSAEYARDIVTLMDALDIASAHWVGHSLGAVISLRAAVEHPERLKSITLIEPGGAPSSITAQYPRELPNCPLPQGVRGNEEPRDSYTPEETRAFLDFLVCNSFGGKDTLEVLPGAYEQALADMPAFNVAVQTPNWPFDPETHLPDMQQPMLYIYFEGGNPVHPEFAELFVEHHRYTEVVGLEGSHHSSHVEQPQPTAEVIADFLDRVAWRDVEFDYVPVEGGQIAYAERGPADGEVLFMIHGGFMADAFLPLAVEDELSSYRIIRPHLRGHGRSSPIPAEAERFGINEHASDMVALLDALEIEQANLVGHSLGGQVALQTALDVPDRIRSIIVIEPGFTSDFSQTLARHAEDWTGEPAGPPPNTLPTDREGRIAWFDRMMVSAFGGRENVERIPGAYEQALDSGLTTFGLTRTKGYLWQFDTRDDLPNLHQPILFMYAGDDYALLAGWFWQNAQDAMLYRFEDGHHSMHMERPEEVAMAIAHFLQIKSE
jgi:3-oxoadipate enol-lactonase